MESLYCNYLILSINSVSRKADQRVGEKSTIYEKFKSILRYRFIMRFRYEL